MDTRREVANLPRQKTSDVESARYSINKNYDLWAIHVATGRQRQLTFGLGPEVSPRLSPDGQRLLCLSSPRKGPHADIFNLLLLDLPHPLDAGRPQARVLFDHHQSPPAPPHPVPASLPEDCRDGVEAVPYNSYAGVDARVIRVELASSKGEIFDPKANGGRMAERVLIQRKLTPAGNTILSESPRTMRGPRLRSSCWVIPLPKGVRAGVKPEETFAALTEARLRDLGWKVRVTNVGIGGERIGQVLLRLEREVLAKKPRLVTLMYGT